MNATEIKIEKSARAACIFLRVSRIFVWVLAAAVFLIGLASCGIYAFAGGEEFMTTMDGQELITDLAGVTGTYPADTVIKVVVAGTLSMLVYLGLCLGILYNAGAFFSDTRKALTPFLVENAKRIRVIGILVLLVSIVPMLMDAAASLVIGLVPDFFTFSLEGIMLAVVIFCVGVLFEHGCALQKEADETL